LFLPPCLSFSAENPRHFRKNRSDPTSETMPALFLNGKRNGCGSFQSREIVDAQLYLARSHSVYQSALDLSKTFKTPSVFSGLFGTSTLDRFFHAPNVLPKRSKICSHNFQFLPVADTLPPR
jgi:hypothetical protein